MYVCFPFTLEIPTYCPKNLSASLNAGNVTAISREIGSQAVFDCLPGCVPIGGVAGPTFTCVAGNNVSGYWSGPDGICSSMLFLNINNKYFYKLERIVITDH